MQGAWQLFSLAVPTKLWDPAGRECGRTFLYLHFFSMARGQAKNPNHSNFIFTRSPQSEHILDVTLFMVLDDDLVLFYEVVLGSALCKLCSTK